MLWLLAFRKASPLVHEVRGIAAAGGATTLALPDFQAGRIDPAPDHQITGPRGAAGESQ